ncbi:BrnT family toxin [Stenoxybacter acetivorans]|uniref:BrnT family toxin n=1 Tax=Stenoxybacter acetivorans TaxID=422441 RepID=UPI00055C7A83|nr:BrnT family toxin [Stenoxybacter acetivorans]
MKIKFEWDSKKAALNFKKHGIGFETAARAFLDPHALTRQDRFENGEYRWQTIALINGHLLLLVALTIRDADGFEIIRIISAREADKKERKRYEQNCSL